MLAHLAHLANDAHSTFVLGVVLGAVERAFFVGRAAVDGSVAGCADFELGKLVELDLDRIMRVALALRLGFTGLKDC